MLSTAPITFQYFSLSFRTKLTMLNITPNKQLISVDTTNHFGITGKPSVALIVEGMEFISKMIKIRVSPENAIDNFENKFLNTVDFVSLFTMIKVFARNAACVQIA